MRNCFGFALLRSMLGLNNSRHDAYSTNQMQNQNQFATWSHAFSRARLRAFASSSHWLIVMFTFVVIVVFGVTMTTLGLFSKLINLLEKARMLVILLI